MNGEILRFFEGHMDAMPLYVHLEEAIMAEIPDASIRVSKTQISFSCKRGFAVVSFAPVRKSKDHPRAYLTLSFGLGYRKESVRIDGAVEPYPNRWTHHVMVTAHEEIDEELLGWLREAAAFSAAKR